MADPDCNFEMFFCDLLSLFYRFGTALYCARFLAALASLGPSRHQAPPSRAMPVSALRVTIDVDLSVHSCPPWQYRGSALRTKREVHSG